MIRKCYNFFCQVHHTGAWYHLTPISLIQTVINIQRTQVNTEIKFTGLNIWSEMLKIMHCRLLSVLVFLSVHIRVCKVFTENSIVKMKPEEPYAWRKNSREGKIEQESRTKNMTWTWHRRRQITVQADSIYLSDKISMVWQKKVVLK